MQEVMDTREQWHLGQGSGWRGRASPGPIPRVNLAIAKDRQGRFAVDPQATDGRGILHNHMISGGVRLVDLAASSLPDFVYKACWAPAQILDLSHKGHLAEQADADITIIDQTAAKDETTIPAGQVVMHPGVRMGRGPAVVAVAGLGPKGAASEIDHCKEAIQWKR